MARCAANDCHRWRPEVLRRVSGVTISDRWFCSRHCVEQMARQMLVDSARPDARVPGLPPSRLGVLLRSKRAMPAEQLDAALHAQQQTRLPLGAQLLALNFVDADTLVRALAEQAGVRCLTH